MVIINNIFVSLKYKFVFQAAAEKISNDNLVNMIQVLNSAFWLYGVKPFTTKTVNEILSGYYDPLLITAKIFDKSVKDSKFSLLKGVI